MFRERYFKTRKLEFGSEIEAIPVPIAGAGAMYADGLYDGRILPVLILDVSNRPDMLELITVHQESPPGDIEAAWGRRLDEDIILLYITFFRPMALKFILEFPMSHYGLLLDQIMDCRAFHIQAGDKSTKISDNPDAPKIVIGVPNTGFKPHWRVILTKYLRSLYRKKGVSRGESKISADAYLKAWDEAKLTPEGLNGFLG